MAIFSIMRSFLLIAAPLAVLAALETGPGPTSTTDGSALRWIQLNHPLVGVLGQPFLVTAELSSTAMHEVRCEGEVADAAGLLLLSGKWDLVLDEIRGGTVIASASVKPAATGAAVVSRTVSPMIRPRARWTWDAQSLFAHAGNYQLHLHYAGSVYHGELIHIDTTLGPPAWIHLEVQPDKRRAMLGEPVEVSITVTNTGIDTYPMHTGGDYRGASRALSYLFTADRTDGAKGWDPEPLQTCFGGLAQIGGIAPGASEHQEVILGAYVRFPGPGTYQVTAYHGMGFGTPVPGVGRARAGSFTIDIDAPADADCERIVREGIAASQGYDRWRRLAHLHEPAYLEPLRRALVRGGPADTAVDVVDGIDSITTTEATAALIACLEDARPQVQLRALERLSRRMPELDRSAHSAAPDAARADHRLHVLFSSQTWDDKQQDSLIAKLPALVSSTDGEIRNSALMLMGRLGTPDAGEAIAGLADRIVFVADAPERDRNAMTSLQNAAYALGEAHGTPCHADVHSSPGRLVCWSYMIFAGRQFGQQDSTPEADALRLAMLSLPGSRVKTAAIQALFRDAGRLPIPWMALFQDPDVEVWRAALSLAFQAPHAPMMEVIRSCARTGWDADKCKRFDDALKHLADPPAP
jgi:hypothetical protein